MINWNAVGAIGELVGSGAVLITLIYLVIQLRQHSRAIRSMTTQTTFTGFTLISRTLSKRPIMAMEERHAKKKKILGGVQT